MVRLLNYESFVLLSYHPNHVFLGPGIQFLHSQRIEDVLLADP
jgi:hypothetical protein